MPNSIFDAEVTYIPSPLRLILFICRHLISRGYGGLRLYSYVKEGLGELRVNLYYEMDEFGRNGERLAYPQLSIGSFQDFQGGDWPTEFDDYVSRRLSVALAAEEFERRHFRYIEACRTAPEQSYIDWYDGLLSICREDGFPITEEPHLFGVDRNTEIIFSDDSREPVFYSRPPGFGNTIFPFQEDELRKLRAEVAPFLRTEFAGFLSEPSAVTSYPRGGLPKVPLDRRQAARWVTQRRSCCQLYCG